MLLWSQDAFVSRQLDWWGGIVNGRSVCGRWNWVVGLKGALPRRQTRGLLEWCRVLWSFSSSSLDRMRKSELLMELGLPIELRRTGSCGLDPFRGLGEV